MGVILSWTCILAFLLLLSTPAFATVGCGANTDNTTCGNVSDPYEGGSVPGGTALSACGTLASSTNYYLTANIGSTASAQCLLVDWGGHDVHVDLRGYTVTGAIFDRGSGNGNLFYNGTISCNRQTSSGFPYGCLMGYVDGPTTAQWRAHHLTINNTNLSGMGIVFEQDGVVTYSGSGKPYRLDHISITSPSALNLNGRFVSLGSYGQHGTFEADNNDIHCNGVDGCQGIGVGTWTPDSAYIHNNHIVMENNVNQFGRAIVFEPSPGTQVATVYIYDNDITTKANVGVRIWAGTVGTTPAHVYGNVFHQVDLTAGYNTLGAIYVGNNDTNEGTGAPIEIYSNTFELRLGNAVSVDTVKAVNIHDNTVTCYSGDCSSAGYVVSLNETTGGDNTTNAHVWNMTLPGGWSTRAAYYTCGGSSTCQLAGHTTSLTYCNVGTGTLAGGGTATLDTSLCSGTTTATGFHGKGGLRGKAKVY